MNIIVNYFSNISLQRVNIYFEISINASYCNYIHKTKSEKKLLTSWIGTVIVLLTLVLLLKKILSYKNCQVWLLKLD